jgi:Zn-dependent peptidase ImmA (M78 family)
MAVSSGIVGNNTWRKLDPKELRGFSLVDEYAPLNFVNGADYRSAQMFTLARELAPVWLDASGVSNPDLADLDAPRPEIERLCNAIAAEILIPSDELGSATPSVAQDPRGFEHIALRHRPGP